MSLLRDPEADFTALSVGQPLLQQGRVGGPDRQHDLPGDKGRAGIELDNEFRQDILPGPAGYMGHIEMVPADQTAVPDEEGLDDPVGIRVLPLQGHAQDIPVLADPLRHLLFLGDSFDTAQQITVTDRVLKAHFLRGLFHFSLQVRDDRLVVAAQKFQGQADPLPVFLPVHLSGTGGAAASHMVIEAGPVLSDIPGQDPAAVPQGIHAVQKLDGLLDRLGAGKRPEISGFVLFHLPGKEQAGIRLLDSDLDIRIGLIVLEHGIVSGPVLLDQVVLQDQGFQLGIGHDILETVDLFYHTVDLGSPAYDPAKIRADTIMEIYGLPHINDRVLLIVHDIYARLMREFFQFFLKIEHERSGSCFSR